VKQGQKVMGLSKKDRQTAQWEYTFGLSYIFYLHLHASIILKIKEFTMVEIVKNTIKHIRKFSLLIEIYC